MRQHRRKMASLPVSRCGKFPRKRKRPPGQPLNRVSNSITHKKSEVAAGLEPGKIGFAGRRLDRLGIEKSRCKGEGDERRVYSAWVPTKAKGRVIPVKTSSKVSQRNVSVTALEPKDLYTLEEAAYRLSTTLFAVRTLCREGALKHINIGHAWLVSPQAIQAFIREQEKAE